MNIIRFVCPSAVASYNTDSSSSVSSRGQTTDEVTVDMESESMSDRG